MRAADVDQRTLGRAPDLEHERLDVLADAVVLGRALVGRGQDRSRSARARRRGSRRAARRGETVPVMISDSRCAYWPKTCSRSTSRRRWRTSWRAIWAWIRRSVSASSWRTRPVTDLGVGLELAGLVDGELGLRVLDLVDDVRRGIRGSAVCPDRPRRRRPRCSAWRADRPTGWRQRRWRRAAPRDVLLSVQLKKRADKVTVHLRLLLSVPRWRAGPSTKTWESPTFTRRPKRLRRSIHRPPLPPAVMRPDMFLTADPAGARRPERIVGSVRTSAAGTGRSCRHATGAP